MLAKLERIARITPQMGPNTTCLYTITYNELTPIEVHLPNMETAEATDGCLTIPKALDLFTCANLAKLR